MNFRVPFWSVFLQGFSGLCHLVHHTNESHKSYESCDIMRCHVMSCSVVKQVGSCVSIINYYKHCITLRNIHALWRCWCRYRLLMYVCLFGVVLTPIPQGWIQDRRLRSNAYIHLPPQAGSIPVSPSGSVLPPYIILLMFVLFVHVVCMLFLPVFLPVCTKFMEGVDAFCNKNQ